MTKRALVHKAEYLRRLEILKLAGICAQEIVFSANGDMRVIVASDGIAAAKSDEAEDAFNRWAASGKEAPR